MTEKTQGSTPGTQDAVSGDGYRPGPSGLIIPRAEVVRVAREWLETPYILGQEKKGAGCDCATLLLGVYRELGLVLDDNIDFYSHDWFHNAAKDRYLFGAMRHAMKVVEGQCHRRTDALPGAIILTKCAGSRHFNHGGIVTQWPEVIHASTMGVEAINASAHWMWERHEIAILEPEGLV